MSGTQTEPQFKGLRGIFWPIHSFELKKFLPMAFMMFCALFNYTILRNTKDSIVLDEIGAEGISFIKFGLTLPLSMAFFVVYSSLSNALSRERLFYTCVGFFIVFFGLWAFVLYPVRDSIMMSNQAIADLVASYPNLRWPITVAGKWFYALFYSMAELWGSVAMSLLFWQFANQITRVFEAKRYYAMFGLIGNTGAFLAGFALKQTKNIAAHFGSAADSFDISIKIIVGSFLFFAMVFIYLYHYTNKNVMTDPRLYDPADVKPKKKKQKLTLGESMKLIFSSKYLLYILILVVGYGVAINLIEVTWKAQVKKMFPSKDAANAFFGDFVMIAAVVTMVLMLVGQNIVRVFGWLVAALATPLIIFVTGGIFFSTIVVTDWLGWLYTALSATPLMVAVYFGLAFQVLSKSTKYSLFDATKEMAYIPLSEELKGKGKAAVDVVGGRFGKSGGAIIQMILLSTVAGGAANGQDIIAPYLFIFVILIMLLWVYAIMNLSKEFTKANAEKEKTA